MSTCYIKKNEIETLDILIPKKRYTASTITKDLLPDYLINLALYDMQTGINIVNMEDENVQSGYLFAESGIGIKGKNEIVWVEKDTAWNDEEIRDYVSGAPVLVVNGKVQIEWGNKISTQIQGKHKRTAIGFNDEYLILYCSDDEITIEILAERMSTMGCKYAINCDGGGSQHLQEGSKIYKKSYRKNASWLVAWLKEKEEFTVYKFTNNSNKSLPVYETTECKKKIGSLFPYETCDCLYEMPGYQVVLYDITGKNAKKVGFIRS